MSGYFSFRKYVTGYFIRVFYLIGFLALTAGGVGLVIWSARRLQAGSLPPRPGWYYIAAGVGILLVGNVIWRVFCELWVVLFNINDRLVSLDGKFRGEPIPTEVIPEEVPEEPVRGRLVPRRTESLSRPAGVLGLSG